MTKNILISVFFLLITYVSMAQQSPFEKQWDRIDSLELKGRTKTALAEVNVLRSQSLEQKDHLNFVKASIFRWKFQKITLEDAHNEILKDIDHTIGQVPQVYASVLWVIRAKLLRDYFEDNYWTIRGITASDVFDQDEIATWDTRTYVKEINKSYDRAMDNKTELQGMRIEAMLPIIKAVELSRSYRPSLYDVLVHEALSFYRNRYSSFESFNQFFISNEKALFDTSEAFVGYQLMEKDTISFASKALQLYQEIEVAHSGDSNPNAFVYAQLRRFEYADELCKDAKAETWYREALLRLATEYAGNSIEALIKFELAQRYYGDREKPALGYMYNPINYDNLKAMELCKEVIKKYPNSEGAQRCRVLIRQMEAVSIDAKAQRYTLPNKVSRVFVSYKNVDSLELHIIKLPTTYDINRGRFFDKDSLNERFINSSNVQKKYYQLPGPKDYDTHSTEILLPPLEEGTYAYFFTNARLEETHSFAYAFTQVSNISFSKTNYNTYSVLRFVDREYGKSLKKIPVTISGSGVKNSRTYITDALGEIVVPKRKRTRGRDIDILAVNGADSLFSRSYVGYRYDPDEDDYPEAKTVMYLDRDLYRPGQTMHFKGILMRKDKGEVSTVPSEYVLVYMADANNEEIYEQYFKTNEYGSFSGSFKLPVQTLTGQFRIFTEEGDGKDEDSKFWDEIDEGVFNETRKSFRVEEYKRPTFEVLFDDIDRSFRPNDTIVVSGNAKAYLGSVISNAKVEYTINRSSLYLDRYYYGDNTENVDGGETQTDANGEFDLSFQDTLNLGPDEQSTIFLYNIEVAITDINGETRSATQSIRVSMNNLFASLMIADEIPITNDLKYNIETTNLNESHVATSGTIRIFKKKSPERFYRSRLWPAPEIQEISKEEFELHFPNEPYEEAIEADKKGALVYSNQFDGDGIFSMVEESPFREPGSYIVELEATAKDGSKVSTTREITVTSDHSKYLPDAQLFGYRIQNKNFRKDKKIELTLHSCLEDLEVGVFAFDSETRIFAENFKVNGKKRITIPLPANLEDEVAISFRMVRFNTSYSDQTIVKLPVDDSFLTIETSTFRDKLLPGVEEQWSFAIKNDKNEIVDSEVLATMYDMSLDQFGPSRWEPLDITSYSYSNRPFVDFKNMFSTTNFTFRNREVRYRFVRRTFDRLNYFGLTFGRGSWHYNAYVNRLRSEKRKEGMGGSIKGVVLDENGLPLPGVNIMVKNSSNGTQTNFDGEFSIDAKATDVLVFSYIGYLSTEQLANVNPIYITLEPNDESLEEVVVTGYSTPRSKKALGYAVTTIETSESDEIPMLQSISALPGVVAGMNVETVAGVSGAGTEFIIRSKSGIDAANRPLFVIDGVPFEFRDGDANSLRLNENEILDVSILEGLSATVLYGEKGKNGVVIISTRKGLDKLSQVAARKNLDETAFFYPHLTTDKEGKIQFNFTAPEALTRWKLRLLAHTKDAVNGRLTKEVITQKDLSIVPNAPRFLREGDTVVFSAKIANLSGKPMVGNAVLQLFDGLTMEPVDVQMMNQNARKSFTVVTGGNESVFWKVHVPDGMQAVSYKVLALAGDVSDGEQNILPVLTNRTMITESVPILVRSGEDKTFVFENFKNNDSPSLAHHKLTLEYTSNPVWNALQSLPYLMEFPHECSEQTFSRYYANSIAAYLMNSHPKVKEVFDSWKGDGVLQSNLEKNESLKSILIAETPWLRDAQSETERKKRLALLFDAEKNAAKEKEVLKKLKKLQNNDDGFPWFSGGRSNPYITRHIVAGFGHLKKLGVVNGIPDLVDDAVDYLDIALEDDFKKYSRRYNDLENFYQRNSHLHYLYARSFYLEEDPIPPSVQPIVEEVLKHNEQEWLSLGVYEKGMFALVQKRIGNEELAKEILDALKENAVISEVNGAYWKANQSGYYWYQAPVETHALIIEAFTEISEDPEFLEELKIWLLQQKRTSSWSSTKATADATYALLLGGSEMISIDNSVDLMVGGAVVSEEKTKNVSKEAGTGYVKFEWNKEEITPDRSSVTVKNRGESVGFGGFYWQYFEDLDAVKVGTGDGGLQLKKEVFLDDGADGLKLVTGNSKIELGDKITVRLTVTATSNMEFIHLKDLRASGLEPENVLSGYRSQNGAYYYESTRDVATHFFFDAMPKGTYVLEYTLRANNSGDFSGGLSNIESMYAPEFSGHTQGTRIKID